jgi:hypothetical protein
MEMNVMLTPIVGDSAFEEREMEMNVMLTTIDLYSRNEWMEEEMSRKPEIACWQPPRAVARIIRMAWSRRWRDGE